MNAPITGVIRSAYEDAIDHQLTSSEWFYLGLSTRHHPEHGIYWFYTELEETRCHVAIARETITAHDIRVAFALTVSCEQESDKLDALRIEAGQEPAEFVPVIFVPRVTKISAELETLCEMLGVLVIVKEMLS